MKNLKKRKIGFNLRVKTEDQENGRDGKEIRKKQTGYIQYWGVNWERGSEKRERWEAILKERGLLLSRRSIALGTNSFRLYFHLYHFLLV